MIQPDSHWISFQTQLIASQILMIELLQDDENSDVASPFSEGCSADEAGTIWAKPRISV